MVDHRERAKDLHADHLALFECAAANLHHIKRVVVPLHVQLRVHLCGVLPSLREEAVVPKYRTVVMPQIPVLHILGDGVEPLFCVNLVLGAGQLHDLGDHPLLRWCLLAGVQRDIVPWRDEVVGLRILEEAPVLVGPQVPKHLRCHEVRVEMFLPPRMGHCRLPSLTIRAGRRNSNAPLMRARPSLPRSADSSEAQGETQEHRSQHSGSRRHE
mmetsp:Transcript_48455/g.139347  ORF Transcript_48455/g.139347 Transcript_48455/m.139347 type:complete len:213 (+) Transcript_48455:593-1231(+)